MNHLIYFNIRLIIAGMSLVLGAILMWGVIPLKLRGSIFDNSRKCIGAAIMVMPFSTFLVYFLSLRSLMYNLHIASYLTAFYAISILVTVGFIPLLGGPLNFKHSYFRMRFIRGLIGVPVFAMPMVLANLYGDEHLAEIIKNINVILLLTAMTYQIYTFWIQYQEAVQRGNNYYSEDVEVDINWIIKSVLAIFTLEIVCVMSIFFPGMGYEAEMVLTFYRVGTIAYVFSRFVNFMRHFETMMSVCEELQMAEVDDSNEELCCVSLSDEQRSQIKMRLDKWVADRGYIQSGVTIYDVAMEVATNRTYLSLYINTVYECSFRVWVTSMRVEQAKKLLKGGDPIVEISRIVGFSSPQSFMHAFKRVEGVTPTQWRKSQIKDRCIMDESSI